MSSEIDVFSPLSTLLAAVASPGLALCVGAGGGDDLRTLLGSTARHIVLVEPNTRLIDNLHRIGVGDARMRICDFAIAEENGEAVLYRTNFPLLSSMRRPLPRLAKIFSDIQVVSEELVPTMRMESLMADLPVIEDVENILIVDAPGAEVSILDAVFRNKGALRFKHLIIRCSQHAFYEGAGAFGTVEGMVRDEGYLSKCLYRDDSGFVDAWMMLQEDSDLADGEDEYDYQPRAVVRALDDLRRALNAKSEIVHDLQAKLGEAEGTLAQLEGRLADVHAMSEDLAVQVHSQTERATHQDETLRQLEARLQTAETERSEREAAFAAEVDSRSHFEARCHDAEQKFRDAEHALHSEVGRGDQLQARVTELEAVQQRLSEVEAQLEDRTSALSDRDSKLEELRHKEWLAGKEFSRFEGQVDILRALLFRDNVL